MDQNDKEVLKHLRMNSRVAVTNIAKVIDSPVSTVFTKIRRMENNVIKKHSSLLNYSKLGLHSWSTIAIKVDKRDKTKMLEFIKANECINSAFEVNNGYDFMLEVVHANKKNLMEFLDELDLCFRVKEKTIFEILSEIKREEYLP